MQQNLLIIVHVLIRVTSKISWDRFRLIEKSLGMVSAGQAVRLNQKYDLPKTSLIHNSKLLILFMLNISSKENHFRYISTSMYIKITNKRLQFIQLKLSFQKQNFRITQLSRREMYAKIK